MNKDIRVSVALPTHPKAIRLIRTCGAIAFYNLIRLWTFVAQSKPTGDLAGMDTVDIEIAAGWEGDRGLFVDTLLELGFIDGNESGYSIHDWQQHNEYATHADERSEIARKAARARWNKKDGGNMLNDARRIAHACKEQCSTMRGAMPFSLSSPSPNELKKPHGPGDRSPCGQPSAPAVVSLKKSPSKHFRERLEHVMAGIRKACETIVSLPPKERPFNPYQAVQKAVNDGMHPNAILDVLTDMAGGWDSGKIKNPWAWWKFVLLKNSRNLWEKENAIQAESFKQAIADLARQKDFLSAIGLTIKTIPAPGSKQSGSV